MEKQLTPASAEDESCLQVVRRRRVIGWAHVEMNGQMNGLL
jgi:hypothetical protein